MASSTPSIGSVLVKSEIEHEIASGRLVLHASAGRARGCSYDLTVGTIFWDGKIIPLQDISKPEQVTVPPGGVIGILTAEELCLPNDMFGTAFAINALSSKGFLVLNPGHIDPGFKGALTVKALNVRKTPIAIHQGEPIFTVIFHRVGVDAPPFDGFSKTRRERERDFNATTVETSPRGLSEIIEADENGPFLGRDGVERMIRGHWMSRWSLSLTVFAVVLSLIAALASIMQLHRDPDQVKSASPKVAGDATLKPLETVCVAPWVSKPVSYGDMPSANPCVLSGR